MCVIAVLYIYATRLLLPNWGVQNCGCKDETCDMGGGGGSRGVLIEVPVVSFPLFNTGMLFRGKFRARAARHIFATHENKRNVA